MQTQKKILNSFFEIFSHHFPYNILKEQESNWWESNNIQTPEMFLKATRAQAENLEYFTKQHQDFSKPAFRFMRKIWRLF